MPASTHTGAVTLKRTDLLLTGNIEQYVLSQVRRTLKMQGLSPVETPEIVSVEESIDDGSKKVSFRVRARPLSEALVG
jgi:hypothetical protein